MYEVEPIKQRSVFDEGMKGQSSSINEAYKVTQLASFKQTQEAKKEKKELEDFQRIYTHTIKPQFEALLKDPNTTQEQYDEFVRVTKVNHPNITKFFGEDWGVGVDAEKRVNFTKTTNLTQEDIDGIPESQRHNFKVGQKFKVKFDVKTGQSSYEMVEEPKKFNINNVDSELIKDTEKRFMNFKGVSQEEAFKQIEAMIAMSNKNKAKGFSHEAGYLLDKATKLRKEWERANKTPFGDDLLQALKEIKDN